MSDNDIFRNDPPQADNQERDYLADLIGEGKPYKDAAAAAKALFHKEQHIQKLEKEAEEYRARLQQAVTLEDVMDRMAASPQQSAAPAQMEPKVVNDPASDPLDVSKVVDERFNALKEKERRDANAAKVKQELTKRFGQTYETSLRQRVEALGLTNQEANELAQTRPEAFLAMLGTPQKPAADVTPPTGFRGVQGPSGKKFRDYQKVYHTNRKLYDSREFQLEMHAEAKRQGPSFYD